MMLSYTCEVNEMDAINHAWTMLKDYRGEEYQSFCQRCHAPIDSKSLPMLAKIRGLCLDCYGEERGY